MWKWTANRMPPTRCSGASRMRNRSRVEGRAEPRKGPGVVAAMPSPGPLRGSARHRISTCRFSTSPQLASLPLIEPRRNGGHGRDLKLGAANLGGLGVRAAGKRDDHTLQVVDGLLTLTFLQVRISELQVHRAELVAQVLGRFLEDG